MDRHVYKGGEPVDDGRETARGLWTQTRASPSRQPTRAVENRFRVWTADPENSRKTADDDFPARDSSYSQRGAGFTSFGA